MNQRLTIADVADLAGVSYQTVSRVINNKPDVSSTTRQRVLGIIDETGYRPSYLARGLATARTATIGLVVPDISNPYFSDLARGVEQAGQAHGYSVLLCNTDEDPEREIEVLKMLDEKQVDGVIVSGLRQDSVNLQRALSRFRAVVLVNRHLNGKTIPAVIVDDVAGGYLATEHLLKLGRTMIGYVAGPKNAYSGIHRARGYRQALDEAGIVSEAGWVQHCAPTVAGGEEATRILLSDYPDLSALFCYNDLVAVGALRACAALGQRVPEDIAIVGYDDIMLAALVSPALTTCRIPRSKMGSQAMTMLLACIDGGGESCGEIVFAPELIVRVSAPASTQQEEA